MTQPTTDSAVTLGITQDIANWVYSKTSILAEIIGQTQNQHQVAFCAYLDPKRLCQFHGRVRNRQLYPIAALKAGLRM